MASWSLDVFLQEMQHLDKWMSQRDTWSTLNQPEPQTPLLWKPPQRWCTLLHHTRRKKQRTRKRGHKEKILSAFFFGGDSLTTSQYTTVKKVKKRPRGLDFYVDPKVLVDVRDRLNNCENCTVWYDVRKYDVTERFFVHFIISKPNLIVVINKLSGSLSILIGLRRGLREQVCRTIHVLVQHPSSPRRNRFWRDTFFVVFAPCLPLLWEKNVLYAQRK